MKHTKIHRGYNVFTGEDVYVTIYEYGTYPVLAKPGYGKSSEIKEIINELHLVTNRQIIIFDRDFEWEYALTHPNWNGAEPLCVRNYHSVKNFSIKVSDIKGNDWWYLDPNMGSVALRWISRIANQGQPDHLDDPEKFYEMCCDMPSSKTEVKGWNEKYQSLQISQPVHVETKKALVEKALSLKDEFYGSEKCNKKGTVYIEDWLDEIAKAPLLFIDLGVTGYAPSAFKGYIMGHILNRIEKYLIELRAIIVIDEADYFAGNPNFYPTYKSTDVLVTYVTKYRKKSVNMFFISQSYEQLHPIILKNATAEIIGQLESNDRHDRYELWTKVMRRADLLFNQRPFILIDHIRPSLGYVPYYPKEPRCNILTQGRNFKSG